ncbi:hypothetical protein [Microbispora sp. KK1-11]|uniref:hypothetical protein n=1 Tax=Microbispora sp. KK1-11 TaxID=2053005 RepID=UPI0011578BFE|nr:hypothetical protein [Microbispora sp. KK1-11]TQS30029.1 hypothetical protein FLW16_06625 [Microbispora sp. KK1-11]
MTEALSAHPSLVARLAEIRQEVAGLLGDIDTRVKPKPDRIATAGDGFPGPVWDPAETWTVRVDDPADVSPACVFVNHPHMWDDDVIPLRPDDARRIGMALLAAAEWADKVRSRDVREAS